MSRKLLQISLIILGLVPTITGALTMMGINDPLFADLHLPHSALLDSDLRFLGGVWLGLGITVLATVSYLEKYFAVYRILWGMIFLGGIGRLISMFVIGLPPVPFIGFTVLEIVGAPIFLYWHYQLVKNIDSASKEIE
ncbi:MAG: DUF4345 domain-containing protein [Anaerolineales bacterium]|nr:DUF4345 domain-containing protein [Anaerolineales bacterium]